MDNILCTSVCNSFIFLGLFFIGMPISTLNRVPWQPLIFCLKVSQRDPHNKSFPGKVGEEGAKATGDGEGVAK